MWQLYLVDRFYCYLSHKRYNTMAHKKPIIFVGRGCLCYTQELGNWSMILAVPVWCKTTERARKYVSSPLPWLGRRLQDRVAAYSQVGEMVLSLFPHPWWRHQMETFFRVTGPLCGEFTGYRWIPHTKASDAEFDVFIDLCMNKWLSKQSWGCWFETPSRSLWRHCNVNDSQ